MKFSHTFSIFLFITVFSLTLSKCKENTPEPNPGSQSKDSEISLNDDSYSLHLMKNVREKLNIQTSEIREVNPRESIVIRGEILADPDRIRVVGTHLAGKVLKIFKKEGEYIKKGEPLVELDSPEITQLRSKYLSAVSRYQTAQKNAERIRELKTLKLASDQEAQIAESEATSWKWETKSIGDQLSSNGVSADGNGSIILIRAPISGTILERKAIPGELVPAQGTILSIADLRSVWFSGQIFENQLSKVKIGQSANLSLNAYPDRVFIGKLSYLGLELNKESRAIPARFLVNNEEGLLKIGLFGQASLESNEESPQRDMGTKKIWRVPQSAIVSYKGKDYMFVAESDLEYTFRPVLVLDGDSSFVNLQGEITSGEKVVTAGAYTLKSILLKSTFAEGNE
jgi:cobalt-zinc-cadmium efflux system membrane fusion protein